MMLIKNINNNKKVLRETLKHVLPRIKKMTKKQVADRLQKTYNLIYGKKDSNNDKNT